MNNLINENNATDLVKKLGLNEIAIGPVNRGVALKEELYVAFRESKGGACYLSFHYTAEFAKKLGWVGKRIKITSNGNDIIGVDVVDGVGYKQMTRGLARRLEISVTWKSEICKRPVIGHLKFQQLMSGSQLIIQIDPSSFVPNS